MTSTPPDTRPRRRWMGASVRSNALACLILITSTGAQPARVLVPGDYSTIGGAIGAAVDGDTIEVCEGTYNEHRLEFLGKSIVVESSNPKDPAVVAATVIQGDYTEPLVLFLSDEDSTTVLQGFTLTRGASFDDYPQYRGGAISFWNAGPTIRYCVVDSNYAVNKGGGIRIKGDGAIVEHCVFRGNYAEYGGGGAFVGFGSSAVFRWCSFEGNAIGIGEGGGVSLDRSLGTTFDSCQFLDNETISWGGGLSSGSSDPVLRNCVISGNYAGGGGGGILCRYRTPVLIGCTIIGNESEEPGSAIKVQADGPDLINCVVSNNARGEGIVVLVRGADSSVHVENCTFTQNWTGAGGAVFSFESQDGNESSIRNTIIWDNGGRALRWEEEAPLVSYSNIEDGAYSSSEGTIDQDPRFVTRGGFDYLLHPASPCVDSGDPVLTDGISDWHPRWPNWYPNGPRSDMGAYGGPQNWVWIDERR